ncbi:MAG: carbohydrate ABC transporter permease [Chthoniobacterales bacterium]
MSPISARHQAANAPVSVTKSSSLRQTSGPEKKQAVFVGATVRHIVLAIFLIYCILPAMWIISAMTKDNGQIFTTFGLWFSYPLHFLENLGGLISYQDGIFVRWFGNSLIYAGSISFGSTMICALGGYAFSKYDFPAKQFIFNFILGTIMVPSTALVLPLFLMLNKIGLVNNMLGVILPSLVNPFGLYLMKVFWDSSLPNELIEASRLEGASELQIFWRIGLPLMQTGLVTVALLAFVGAWNNFFLPLIVLSEQHLFPLTLGLNVWDSLTSAAGGKPIYNLIAVGSMVSVLPLLIAFVVLGKYWRGGLTAGATKG